MEQNKQTNKTNLKLFGNSKFQFKARLHCCSMQVIINKCFLLNPEKKFGANPSCCFREKRTFNSEK